MNLTHFDEEGHARMVDVSAKSKESQREAVATATVRMQAETFRLIQDKAIAKGDVLNVARIAGIMAAKRCSDLIPLCHPIFLTSVEILFHPDEHISAISIEVRTKSTGQTGVEMEALTAASVAALTIYDMCKAVDRSMVISDIMLQEKKGGKSGHWTRQ
ncbi:MAG TPA: cyclic pyranopterin monophosphate synthase MoaC [Thermodesulfovibrionia bacterium]|nr:cyclic pyranopterin monophosphate synthase MoaC [Thermodesulfovibrionia bacterium]